MHCAGRRRARALTASRACCASRPWGNGVGARNLEGMLEGSSMLLAGGALDKGEAPGAISIEGLLEPVVEG